MSASNPCSDKYNMWFGVDIKLIALLVKAILLNVIKGLVTY